MTYLTITTIFSEMYFLEHAPFRRAYQIYLCFDVEHNLETRTGDMNVREGCRPIHHAKLIVWPPM